MKDEWNQDRFKGQNNRELGRDTGEVRNLTIIK